MRKNTSKTIPTSEVKARVKMWRSGKNWVYGLLFFFGLAGISMGKGEVVHADVQPTVSVDQKATVDAALTQAKVKLQTSAQDATTTDTAATEATEADEDQPTAEASTVSGDTAETTNDQEKTSDATTDAAVTAPAETSASTLASDEGQTVATSQAGTDATSTETTDADAAQSTEGDQPTTTSEPQEDASATDTTATQTDRSATADAATTKDKDYSTPPVKSLLSTADVQALNEALPEESATDADADTDATDKGTFSVSDPVHPAGAFYYKADDASNLYSFFEGKSGTTSLVLSADRDDPTQISYTIIGGSSEATPKKLTANKIGPLDGFTLFNGTDSIYVSASNLTIIYEMHTHIHKAMKFLGAVTQY